LHRTIHLASQHKDNTQKTQFSQSYSDALGFLDIINNSHDNPVYHCTPEGGSKIGHLKTLYDTASQHQHTRIDYQCENTQG